MDLESLGEERVQKQLAQHEDGHLESEHAEQNHDHEFVHERTECDRHEGAEGPVLALVFVEPLLDLALEPLTHDAVPLPVELHHG